MVLTSLVLCATVAAAEDKEGAEADRPTGLALHVGKLVAMDEAGTVINDAVLLVRYVKAESTLDPAVRIGTGPVIRGEIEAMGPADKVKIPDGYRVLEFSEQWLVPGIVEAHDHAAAGGWSDLNDMVYQTNPGLDTRCVPQPDCDWVKQARRGGITTVMLLPGSGTNLAGMGTLVNLGGSNPDEVMIRSPGSLKVAQAGNPEWYFGGNGRSFMNWNTRQTMKKALAYHQRWEAYEQAASASEATSAAAEDRPIAKPEFDPIWDGIRGVFRGEYPAAVHTQIYQVLLETVQMFGGEFRLWSRTEHSSFDAWKVGPLVRELELRLAPSDGRTKGGWYTIQGPRQYHFDRTARRMIGNASGWWKNGVRNLAINTDAPVVPQETLTFQAAMACWYGWLPYPALKAITNITAKAVGDYDNVGSLEPGKQADLSIWTGDPLDPRSACLMTIINGRIVYDGTQGVRRL